MSKLHSVIIKGCFFSHQFEEKTEDKVFSRSGADHAEVRRQEPPFHTAARYTHACSCTVRAHTCVHTPACTHERWTFLCTGIRVALGNTDTRSLHMYHLHIFAQSETRCRHTQISGVLTHICSRTCVGPNDSARTRACVKAHLGVQGAPTPGADLQLSVCTSIRAVETLGYLYLSIIKINK